MTIPTPCAILAITHVHMRIALHIEGCEESSGSYLLGSELCCG